MATAMMPSQLLGVNKGSILQSVNVGHLLSGHLYSLDVNATVIHVSLSTSFTLLPYLNRSSTKLYDGPGLLHP